MLSIHICIEASKLDISKPMNLVSCQVISVACVRAAEISSAEATIILHLKLQIALTWTNQPITLSTNMALFQIEWVRVQTVQVLGW